MASQEDQCPACARVKEKYRGLSTEPDSFLVHIDVNIFTKSTDREIRKKKQKEKTDRLERLSKVASALRNSEGGSILVHLSGHEKGDRYLGYFDEFVGAAFTYLIEDGQLYANTYRRSWLCDQELFFDEEDFLCVFVSKTNGLSTVDFNTKIRNDFENVKPTPLNILSTLVNLKPQRESLRPIIRGLNLNLLQESRNIEFKSIAKCNIDTEDIPTFVNFIWINLKLRENLTSMSKISDGGSFYVGIAENSDNRNLNPSISAELEGFGLADDQSGYEQEIKSKIRSDISVLNSDGTFDDAPDDLIDIQFHLIPGRRPPKYILEVSVRQFAGIVFYEKGGPRAYTINKGGNIRRLEPEEWLERVPFEYLVCPLLVV